MVEEVTCPDIDATTDFQCELPVGHYGFCQAKVLWIGDDWHA